MSRDLPPDIETAIDQPVVRPFFALKVDLPDPVYVFTGSGKFSFPDGDGVMREWIGAGELGALEPGSEATDGSATGMKAAFYQIPSEFRDDIADQATPGALIELHFGSFNESFQHVEAVTVLNKFRLDEYKITDGGDTLAVEIAGEGRGIDQRRPAIKRFTNEYQQRKHPGDRFFEYVPQMTEVSILWARASQNAASVGSGGFGSGGGGGFNESTHLY